MKGVKKCFGVLLALFIMVGLSLSVCSVDSSALKHDYEAIPLLAPNVPLVFETVDNKQTIDWDYQYDNLSFTQNNQFLTQVSGFDLYWEGAGYYDQLENLLFVDGTNALLMDMSYDGSKCLYSDFSSVIDGFSFATDSNDPSYHYGGIYSPGRYYDNSLNFSQVTTEAVCYHRNPFGISPQPAFDLTSITNELDKLAFTHNLDPYWYAYDGLYVHSSFVSDEGVHYDHSFSFTDMFNQPIRQFSRMRLPLYDYSHYWTDPDNFYDGRLIEFFGSFNFSGSFTLNQNLDYFRVHIYGFSQEGNRSDYNVGCQTSIEDQTLSFRCSTYLPTDYIFIYPVLEMYAQDSYVFTTNSDWYFGSFYMVTDNNYNTGDSFGGLTRGFGNAASDAMNDEANTADWFSSLVNMFNFGLINPFAPIFELFNDQSTCANIPTLAGMLHSEETQVCPWFSAETRAIVTPVVGLSTMMLLFGFVVRWLGSGSGNFLEDAGSIEPPGTGRVGDSVQSHGWRIKH